MLQICINHNGKTTAEALGVSQLKVEAKSVCILTKWDNGFYKPPTKIFEDIFKPSFLNDAEKVMVFNTVTNVLRDNFSVDLARVR